ncbi:uncharacterized protein LOC128905864 [Rissa tridactyla]|uniref:uncharacterized protein LOC128905864 n=1 Tax=Rissa tridactyla TaxID=75485 RepID=UPI0023BAC85D|nr:uncharacterized protein LOC128905864 [Rissa tridactyla]XP_054048440.1 uncharacterized protein LOC128905864 [Rissa tridactyla]XP_054048449.1 uncharacterized protein LOC128905864 [Rissa tridactyla]XP_054048459.1 uncharacterized protein LOC128905864 [Rissa tridactyla]XP_054048467.1 uncharacterized protein LOC128905864 [Rissa tridactyla]
MRAKGFSRKYSNCLPYRGLKKHTAKRPAAALLLFKRRNHRPLLRGKGATACPLLRRTRWRRGTQGMLGAVVRRLRSAGLLSHPAGKRWQVLAKRSVRGLFLPPLLLRSGLGMSESEAAQRGGVPGTKGVLHKTRMSPINVIASQMKKARGTLSNKVLSERMPKAVIKGLSEEAEDMYSERRRQLESKHSSQEIDLLRIFHCVKILLDCDAQRIQCLCI